MRCKKYMTMRLSLDNTINHSIPSRGYDHKWSVKFYFSCVRLLDTVGRKSPERKYTNFFRRRIEST